MISLYNGDAPRRVLVTGATGKVGRHVVSQLLARGHSVRALVRDPAAARLPDGVELVRGDLGAPETLRGQAEGMDSVFFLWPFFSADGAAEVLQAMREAAARVVYLSAIGGRAGDGTPVFHHDVERAIEASGVEWTMLRAGGFAANTLWWAEQIRGGVVRWPFADAARSLIHEQDVADVAVRALTGDGHGGAKYELTGPESITQAEQVRIIGQVIRRPVRFEEISPDEAREQMLAGGLPPEFADSSLAYWASLIARPEPVTTTVQDVTRVPARTFRTWAMDHAAAFR